MGTLISFDHMSDDLTYDCGKVMSAIGDSPLNCLHCVTVHTVPAAVRWRTTEVLRGALRSLRQQYDHHMKAHHG